MDGQIELSKNQIERIKDNLKAFDVNVRDYKITEGDFEGFYVFVPKNAESWMYYCKTLNELDGWMIGVIQGLNRKELKELWQKNKDYYFFEERKNK